MHRKMIAALVAGTLMQVARPAIAEPAAGAPHARIMNARVAAAFEVARTRSAGFRAIVAAIDASDTYLVIEDGRCPDPAIRSCVQLLAAGMPGVRALRVRLESRQPLTVIIAELAHELRHAVEIAVHPEVVDGASLAAMYRAIGYRSCATYASECWETREAQAAERLVTQEVKSFQSFAAIKP